MTIKAKVSGMVVVQVGKNGLTDNTVVEVLKNLRKGYVVKVKFLRSSLEGVDRAKSSEELLGRVQKIMSVNKKLVGNVLELKSAINQDKYKGLEKKQGTKKTSVVKKKHKKL